MPYSLVLVSKVSGFYERSELSGDGPIGEIVCHECGEMMPLTGAQFRGEAPVKCRSCISPEMFIRDRKVIRPFVWVIRMEQHGGW